MNNLFDFVAMSRKCTSVSFLFLLFSSLSINAQEVDYSVISVKEETGTNFTRITNETDMVVMPMVKRSSHGCEWSTNSVIGISKEGNILGFIANRNGSKNIFIKDLSKTGTTVQRTNRPEIIDFTYSPDGKTICFTEKSGKVNSLFTTSSTQGYICKQITTGALDFSPIYSMDMQQIFFTRQEKAGTSIWSCNMKDRYLSNYAIGMNPCPMKDKTSILCVRKSAIGKCEIWRINISSGIEECIVSDQNKSFTSPSVSPNGEWILFVGESALQHGKKTYYNTDLYVCRLDGSDLTQLTYHAADDISPVWSQDGQAIYFVSKRGSAEGNANVWKMDFKL